MQHLARNLKRYPFYAYQASARGGEVHVRVAADRVFPTGKAVTVIKSSLLVQGSARKDLADRPCCKGPVYQRR